jgi:hypothetical protein
MRRSVLSYFIAAHTVYLIHVHGPTGQDIEVNVIEISSIREPREDAQSHFATGTKCLIYMTSGQFISTAETCEDIVKKIAVLDQPVPEKQ